jgi:hypothetical protein
VREREIMKEREKSTGSDRWGEKAKKRYLGNEKREIGDMKTIISAHTDSFSPYIYIYIFIS